MEDFNIPSSQRTIVLNSLQALIGDVPPYFWAFCQVCDLQALENLVEIARISPPAVRVLATQAYTAVLYWTQSAQGTSRRSTPVQGLGSSSTGSPLAKRQKTTGSPTTTPLLASLPILRRSKAATDLAKERDSYCCVLSGAPTVDAAHIYPFCRLSGSEEDTFGARHTFWSCLRFFWSEEKVATWEAEVFPRGLSERGDETVDNRITLSKEVHCQWNRGAFALKPISISDSNTTLRVQFFWQKKQSDIRTTISLCAVPHSTEALDRNEGAFGYGETRILGKENQLIKSGDIFDLHTDDPMNKPLPSFQLLELQWHLTRVVGMAGAAFPYELESGYDSDEDVPGLDLDEAGDTSFVSGHSNSPNFLDKVNRFLIESVKHYPEETGFGAGAESEMIVQ